MEYTNIYRNGKPQYFFIKLDAENEYNFLQPYFLLTSYDRPRRAGSLKWIAYFPVLCGKAANRTDTVIPVLLTCTKL